jgi:regulator of replication initiation timing
MASIAPFLVSKASAENAENTKMNQGDLIVENTKLRQQVTTLQSENAKLVSENAQLKKRKAGASTTADTSEPASKRFKTPGQRTKLFEKWAKSLTRESSKHKITNGGCFNDTYTVTVKEGMPWTVADFESIFAGKGVKIQPTRENKPTSQITILRFGDFDEIAKLCAEVTGGAACIIAQDGYQAQSWRSRSFCKSYRNGDLSAGLKSLEVHFNKNKLSLHLQFTLETDDEDY